MEGQHLTARIDAVVENVREFKDTNQREHGALWEQLHQLRDKLDRVPNWMTIVFGLVCTLAGIAIGKLI